MTTPNPSSDASLQLSVLRDDAALAALQADWEQLEEQAPTAGRYVTCSYVRLAWKHLRQPGNELYLITVREAGRLIGLLPLVRVTERHYRLQLKVLRHIGIWEGERPGVLALGEPDRIWAAAWRLLMKRRADWQVLDLRELDPLSWPLRELQRPRHGFSAQLQADIGAPYQLLSGNWADHEAQRNAALRMHRENSLQRLEQALPGLCIGVAEQPEDVLVAFDRYLALERALVQQGDGVTIGADPHCVAFYREWLPQLAERGDAAVWLMGDGDTDVAALIRLRAGRVWIERHACYAPEHARFTPSLLLALEALRRSFSNSLLTECDVVNLREPGGELPSYTHWYGGRRPTQRLSVWNLRSRLAPVALLRWVRQLRGGATAVAPGA
jgi:CelD/BcsL family acetyltransferase involved in cellulose biosynthesis